MSTLTGSLSPGLETVVVAAGEGENERLMERQRNRRSWLLLLPALVVTTVAAIAPLIFIVWVSFWSTEGLQLTRTFDLAAWGRVFTDPTFYRLTWSTLRTVLTVLVLVGLLGLTAGYYLARYVTSRRLQALLLMLAILPF